MIWFESVSINAAIKKEEETHFEMIGNASISCGIIYETNIKWFKFNYFNAVIK